MRTETRDRLGINNCFAVKRWPRPGDWGLDHLLVENLVTDREPSTISSIKNILAKRSVAHAPVQHQQSDGLADHHWPFTPERNAVGRVDPGRVLHTLAGAGATDVLARRFTETAAKVRASLPVPG
jgi:hypothetical protein